MRPALLLLTFLAAPFVAGAQTDAEQRGLAIAVEADQQDSGWGDMRADLEMLLRNAQGEETRRELRMRLLEVPGDGDKSLTVFDAPADIKGTAFLSYSHALEPDEQWLFLPALKRVKRIASANKSGPFVGSEFAYEDLSSDEVEKYAYRFVEEAEYEGEPVWVLDRTPRYEYSGYTRQRVWMSRRMLRPLRIDFFDRKESLLKTATFHDYRQYLDRYWRAHRFEMVNLQTGRSTTLSWSEFRFGNGYDDRDFDRNTLKRAR